MRVKKLLEKTLICFTFIFLLCCYSTEVQAQNNSKKVWVVKTKDGNKYAGTITKRERSFIIMETEALGEIQIDKKNIKSIDEIDKSQLIAGEYLKVNSKTSRYFFAPSALSLRKGEGYYQNTWIFFNQVNYGITDNIDLGIGMVPLFLFNGAPTPFWVTPKVSFPVSENFSLGGGALVATIIGGNVTNNFAGSAYGVATFGNNSSNISVGLGYGFANGVWADTPLLTVSGLLRTGKKAFLMTENYFVGIDGNINSITFIGGRTAWERVQLDYGLVTSFNSLGDGFGAIPWLSLAIPFGK